MQLHCKKTQGDISLSEMEVADQSLPGEEFIYVVDTELLIRLQCRNIPACTMVILKFAKIFLRIFQ